MHECHIVTFSMPPPPPLCHRSVLTVTYTHYLLSLLLITCMHCESLKPLTLDRDATICHRGQGQYIAPVLLSAAPIIVCSHWDHFCPSTVSQSPAVLKGDWHCSVNTESFFHNCPFWITGRANAHAHPHTRAHTPTSSSTQLHSFHQSLEIHSHNWKGLTSTLLETFEGKLRCSAHVTLPESSSETAVPPWLIRSVPLGWGTLGCVNVLFQSANRSC